MHALRRFVTESLNARGMTAAEFGRAGGLSNQHVSQLLNDERERMASMPKHKTIEGISRALNVPEPYVVAIAVEAMGYDLGEARTAADLSSLHDEALLTELSARLKSRRGREDVGNDERSAANERAPGSGANLTAGPWPEKERPPAPPADAAARSQKGKGKTQEARERQDIEGESP